MILKLNSFNIRLQAHCLEVQKLKLIIHETLNLLLSYILRENVKTSTLETWIAKYPTLESVDDDQFRSPVEITALLSQLSPQESAMIMSLPEESRDLISEDLYSFLFALINGLLKRLPLLDPTFSSIDFVHLLDDDTEFAKKVKAFAKSLNSQDEKGWSVLHDELNRMATFGHKYFTNKAKDCFHLWSLVEQEDFNILPMLARQAQALATTSCDVEQAFSCMKLIKTERRNRIKDTTLEAIMIIWSIMKRYKKKSQRNNAHEDALDIEEYVDYDKSNFQASERMISLYDNVINSISERKSRKRKERKERNLVSEPETLGSHALKRILTI